MKQKSPWAWIPSLYFTQGIPYVLIALLTAPMFVNLGLSNAEMAYYSSLLGFPWILKPIWSPIVGAMKSNRFWVVVTQILMGALFAITAFFIVQDGSFTASDNFEFRGNFAWFFAFLMLLAFNSATHDISADGLYIEVLSEDKQSFYVGIRSSFYRVAMIAGQGGLLALAGVLSEGGSLGIDNWGIHFFSFSGFDGDFHKAWSYIFIAVGAYLAIIGAYHAFMLPKSKVVNDVIDLSQIKNDILDTFITFFKIKNIGIHLGVLLLFRLGEAQLVKLAQPFLLDAKINGGLGLSNTEIGLLYGTFGVLALTVGGILGGVIVSKDGLKRWFFPMILAINLPNSMYLLMAYFVPESSISIGSAIAIEQFGYGFGFTAYMMYMIYITKDSGKYKTAHFAFATGLMALGMTLPGMSSGWLQEQLGYVNFFWWVLISMVPMLLLYKFVKIEPGFGKKK